MAPKTREEIEALKENWKKDSCWDLENTEGFEEHAAELHDYQLECEAAWKAKEEERFAKSFDGEMARIKTGIQALESLVGNDMSSIGYAQFRNSCEQTKALLLLAEQVKRIADAIDEISDRGNLDESVRIWGNGK